MPSPAPQSSILQLPYPFDRQWSIAQAAALAGLLESSAPKAGNVHPGAAFADMNFSHFLASSLAVGDCFQRLQRQEPPALGSLVLECVRSVRRLVGCNTNLGTLLLMGPLSLAAARTTQPLATATRAVLDELTAEDCRLVYQAIREANPGGLGRQAGNDIHATPPTCLISAMSQVADVDAVARQYTNGFADVLDRVVPWLAHELARSQTDDAICRVQLRLLAHTPDGLVIRKLGQRMAEEVQARAAAVCQRAQELALSDAQGNGRLIDLPEYKELDTYLRQDGNRRNPGTTADLIAAGLFVLLLRPSGSVSALASQ